MFRNIVCRIIRSCFPDGGLRILDRKIARIKRLKDKMERDNRHYYGDYFYRQHLLQKRILSR